MPGVGLVSVYQMTWDPVPTAVDYDLFTRSPSSEEFKAKINGVVAELATNVPADYTIRACNENGCGPLSPESVTVDNSLCQGF